MRQQPCSGLAQLKWWACDCVLSIACNRLQSCDLDRLHSRARQLLLFFNMMGRTIRLQGCAAGLISLHRNSELCHMVFVQEDNAEVNKQTKIGENKTNLSTKITCRSQHDSWPYTLGRALSTYHTYTIYIKMEKTNGTADNGIIRLCGYGVDSAVHSKDEKWCICQALGKCPGMDCFHRVGGLYMGVEEKCKSKLRLLVVVILNFAWKMLRFLVSSFTHFLCRKGIWWPICLW